MPRIEEMLGIPEDDGPLLPEKPTDQNTLRVGPMWMSQAKAWGHAPSHSMYVYKYIRLSQPPRAIEWHDPTTPVPMRVLESVTFTVDDLWRWLKGDIPLEALIEAKGDGDA